MDPKHFHILAALAAAPIHGYAIRREVEERTDGQVRLWPATLYGSLTELTDRGWIQETASPIGEEDDPRRRYYAITKEGRGALSDEAARLESMAVFARSQLGQDGEVLS